MKDVRTSLTHPLVIDAVAVPGCAGRIGMMMLPGRSSDVGLMGHAWRRNLQADLAVVRAAKPSLLITLNESHEFAPLGVPDFERTLASSGLPWRHLPISDAGVPNAAFEQAWLTVGAEARACLLAGGLVIIHCRAGLGRTGTIAAKLLVELGETPQKAIATIREARPYTIETLAQVKYVETLVSLTP